MLQGPSRFSSSLNVEKIIVFIHGYGASGDDLLALADIWAPQLPHTLFIAPHAPTPCDINPHGYQWFGLPDPQFLNFPQQIAHALKPARTLMCSYLNNLLSQYQRQTSDLILVGFSQGAMLALSMVFEMAPMGAVIGYSGAFYPMDTDTHPSNTPILLAHGIYDQIVHYNFMLQAKRDLNQRGCSVVTRTYDDLMHGINEQGMIDGLQFIQENVYHKKG